MVAEPRAAVRHTRTTTLGNCKRLDPVSRALFTTVTAELMVEALPVDPVPQRILRQGVVEEEPGEALMRAERFVGPSTTADGCQCLSGAQLYRTHRRRRQSRKGLALPRQGA